MHDCDKIAKNYLQSWFPLDLLSTLASGPDFLSLDIVTGGGEQGSDTGNLKILRVVRVARLIKLVRLVRSSRIIKRCASRRAEELGMVASAHHPAITLRAADAAGCAADALLRCCRDSCHPAGTTAAAARCCLCCLAPTCRDGLVCCGCRLRLAFPCLAWI